MTSPRTPSGCSCRAVDAAHLAISDDLRAVALHELGTTSIWAGRPDDAERHLEMALALARRIGRPRLELGALIYSGLAAGLRSTALAAERELQAVDLARAHGWAEQPFVGVAYAVLGSVMLWRGRPQDAEAWLERAEQVLRPETEPTVGVIFHWSRGLLELVRGRLDEALRAFDAAERADALLRTHALAAGVHAHRLVTLIRAGRTEQVEWSVDGSVEMGVVAAALALAQDDPGAAADGLGALDTSGADPRVGDPSPAARSHRARCPRRRRRRVARARTRARPRRARRAPAALPLVRGARPARSPRARADVARRAGGGHPHPARRPRAGAPRRATWSRCRNR